MYTSPKFSGYLIRDTIFEDNGNGIHLGASGDHPTLVCRNRFTANNEFEDATGAFGIYSNEGAKQVLTTSNLFERHNGAAVFFADQGAEQRDILIEHNKSVDDMSFATIFNSIRLRVTANYIQGRVNDPDFKGPASAIFIGANNDDIVVQKNKVTSTTGNGIDITDTGGNGKPGPWPTNVIVRNNKVRNAELSGIEVSATGVGEYQVLHNRSLHNTVYGLHFAPGTNGGTVTGNVALDNHVDCRDRSADGPLNHWTDNIGGTALPAGICTAPTTLDDHHGYDGTTHDKKKFKKQKKHRPDPCACTLPWRF